MGEREYQPPQVPEEVRAVEESRSPGVLKKISKKGKGLLGAVALSLTLGGAGSAAAGEVGKPGIEKVKSGGDRVKDAVEEARQEQRLEADLKREMELGWDAERIINDQPVKPKPESKQPESEAKPHEFVIGTKGTVELDKFGRPKIDKDIGFPLHVYSEPVRPGQTSTESLPPGYSAEAEQSRRTSPRIDLIDLEFKKTELEKNIEFLKKILQEKNLKEKPGEVVRKIFRDVQEKWHKLFEQYKEKRGSDAAAELLVQMSELRKQGEFLQRVLQTMGWDGESEEVIKELLEEITQERNKLGDEYIRKAGNITRKKISGLEKFKKAMRLFKTDDDK